MAGTCRYAHPGTWGHECGKPARWGQRLPKPEHYAEYWCLRCDECRNHTGPDNHGMTRTGWLPYDPQTMRKRWLQNRWPADPVMMESPA